MAETLRMQVYGAWLYEGQWDGHGPLSGKLIRAVGGRYTSPPKGFEPKPGQVTLLGQGETFLVVTPEKEA